ncbi:methyl-accepting chemotaxis protein [Acidaminobacter sp. JC074]|uniref:methyl-accepting chemotaxis protein n=1 Tax=Acidaminobacter sp. JC074 TaxID=2530199 RepID=UPI001F0F7BA6|nr:methyl-accepting chemotaxis protein [Acidaminobacter sp. JC074]MCH4887840.1 methyl-accepting chemotaxis protein [Acidaminobacter sp. JC074]
MLKKIKTQLVLVLVITNLIGILTIALVSYNRNHDLIVNESREKAKSIVDHAVQVIDSEMVKNLSSPQDMNLEAYRLLGAELNSIRTIGSAKYLYIMRKKDGQFEYIIEASDYNSDEPTLLGSVESEIYEGFELASAGNHFVEEDMSESEYGILISAYAPILDKNNQVIAFVGVDYDMTKVYNNFRETAKEIYLIGFILVALLIFVGQVVAGKIANPIISLSQKAKQVSDYDYSLIENTQKTISEEMGNLHEDFHTMIDRNREMITDVKQLTNDVNHVVGDMQAVSKESLQHSENVYDYVEQFSVGITQQTENSEEALTKMTDLDKELEILADQINLVSDRMKAIEETCSNGFETVTLLNDKYKNYYGFSHEMYDEMIRLKKVSEKMDQVVLWNKDIFKKIKMLSLNATIEAAKAGEAGAGFAVVASEIGALSQQSSQATNEISTYINELLDSILQVDMKMTSQSNLTDSISSGISNSQSLFSGISSSILELKGDFHALNKKTSDMGHLKKETYDIISNTTATIQNLSSLTEEVWEATDEQVKIVTRIQNHIGHLNQKSDELSETVSVYKIN